MSKKPNVLFILSDQHNAKVLGHKGHPDIKTPHLDRLAKTGVRFDQAITQNPICTPSRVSFLSGQYAHNHGIYQLGGPQPNALPMMLSTFKQAGYQTAAIGKIHCPEYWVEDQCDTFIETAPGCSIAGAPEYLTYVKEQDIVKEHALSEDRKGPAGQALDGYESPLAFKDSPEGFIVSHCKEFISQSTENDQPFIAHISFPRPHQTYAPVKEFWDMYDENDITLPPNWQWDMKNKAPHLIAQRDMFMREAEDYSLDGKDDYEALCRRKMRGYFGNISMMDHALGEILNYLEEHGLSENTIIVYSTDHGDYACEHGLLEKAPGICSDAITRIPFIWRAPGVSEPGAVCEELVETVDVFPTLCKLAGLDFPETSDGKDLTPLLQGKSDPLRRVAVTEFAWSKSLRCGDWRYVYYPQEMFAEEYPEGFGELYNLKEDPWECNNLYFNDIWKEKRHELERALMDWLVTSSRVVGTNGANDFKSQQTIKRCGVEVFKDGKIGYRQLSKLQQKNYL